MSLAIYFTVPGDPRGKGRPRFAARGSFVTAYTDAKTLAYEAAIADAGAKAMGERPALETPVSLRIECHMGVPKSWGKKAREEALAGYAVPGKPDLDNVAKAVMDALNGVLYADDKQVCVLRISKQYTLEPRIEIYAYEVLT